MGTVTSWVRSDNNVSNQFFMYIFEIPEISGIQICLKKAIFGAENLFFKVDLDSWVLKNFKIIKVNFKLSIIKQRVGKLSFYLQLKLSPGGFVRFQIRNLKIQISYNVCVYSEIRSVQTLCISNVL